MRVRGEYVIKLGSYQHPNKGVLVHRTIRHQFYLWDCALIDVPTTDDNRTADTLFQQFGDQSLWQKFTFAKRRQLAGSRLLSFEILIYSFKCVRPRTGCSTPNCLPCCSFTRFTTLIYLNIDYVKLTMVHSLIFWICSGLSSILLDIENCDNRILCYDHAHSTKWFTALQNPLALSTVIERKRKGKITVLLIFL